MKLMKIDFDPNKPGIRIETNTVKLQKYLALSGLGSRRKCEEIIAKRIVSVNGIPILKPGFRVSFSDVVKVNNKIVKPLGRKVYLAVNKPVGYICSNTDVFGRLIVKELLPKEFEKYHIYNVGRLDYNSSGLIFYTNDGDFANIIMHPSFEVKKVYKVEISKDINISSLENYKREGITVNSIKYSLDSYKIKSSKEVILTLNEGKNREIRKVFDFWGIKIKKLERIKIGIVELGELKTGEFRKLTKKEIKWFLSRQRSG